MLELFDKKHMGQLLLSVLFIIYLVMGGNTPEMVAGMVDTLVGKFIILVIVLVLFLRANILLALLGLIVAYKLMSDSSKITGIDALKSYLPTEERKTSEFSALNQFPYTLEQEVVSKMAPIVNTGFTLSQPSYKPKLDDTYNASSVTELN